MNKKIVDKVIPTSIQLGNYSIELKKFKETYGHDDSLPFQADLYINGEHVARTYNDGWGGAATIEPLNNNTSIIIKEVKSFLKKAQIPYFSLIKGLKEQYSDLLSYKDLSFIVDMLAEQCYMHKWAKSHINKGIVYIKPATMELGCMKAFNVPIDEVLEDDFLLNHYNMRCKQLTDKGYIVINVLDK